MNIWKFNSVNNDYTPFIYARDEDMAARLFLTDGTPKNWHVRPKCRPYVEKQKKKKQLPLADLSYISPGTILLNHKAYTALKDFLAPFGQLLEVECMNEGGLLGDKLSELYYFYNVTNIISCIDYENSEKSFNSIDKESYFPDRIPSDVQIYRDPQRLRVQIYLSELAKEQFATLIAENKLTGGEFVR
jgi:hypothetical protein